MGSTPTPQFGFDTTGLDVTKVYANNIKGKTYLVTGPSEQSIGASVAVALATGSPKKLILAGRSLAKIQPVIDQIKSTNSSIKVEFLQIDLGSFQSVRNAATQFDNSNETLHGLFNVAGVMGMKEYTTSSDGNEAHFQTNYLSHFLLANQLAPKLMAAKGVIVNVTSGGYGQSGVNFTDPNFDGGKTYNPWNAYGQSKTAQILNAISLTEKLKSKGVIAFAADPGLVLDSKLQSNSAVSAETFDMGLQMGADKFGISKADIIAMNKPKTLAQSSAPILLPALSPEWRDHAPAFVKDCTILPTLEHASGSDNAAKLWSLSEKMVGETFNF